MPETFLHGTEVLEVSSGPRPIKTVSSSVIGLVGTGISDGATASIEIGAANGKLKFTSTAEGAAGNDITVRAINPGTNNAALAITVAAKAITISLATDGTGASTSTATQVRTAFTASAAATALALCALGTGSTGSTVYAAHAATSLAGGINSSFPLNKPVLVTSGGNIDSALGSNSYLGKALEAIYKQAGAVVVVIRTDDVAGDATSFTGVFALKQAKTDLGITPRILIAENGGDDEVTASLKSVATSLRAIAVIGLDVNTATDATAWVNENANERTFTFWPFVNGGQDPAPFVAGAIARSDNERGFWWSPSNFEVFGITSLDHPVDFQLGDPTSLANILNESNVSTFIKEGGFRLWGNRSGSIDPKWAFLCIRRTADIINDSVLKNHLWAVDRGITKTYLSDVAEGVSAYLRTLKTLGAVLGGKCWPHPDLNTAANITQGKPYFVFDFTGVYPAEHVTFMSMLVDDYIQELTL